MKINDFKIGHTFYGSGNFLWLCTDIGTRTVTAIFLDPKKEDVWFQGPPYDVNEIVFNEIDMSHCYTGSIFDGIALNLDRNSLHPHFNSNDSFKMIRQAIADKKENHLKIFGYKPAILKRDRVTPDYRILHPYSRYIDNNVWFIRVYDIFNCTFEDILEDTFIHYPAAQRSDFEKAIYQQELKNSDDSGKI